MLPLLALVLQTDELGADARLKAPLTVAERYLPLPEFAGRLAAATKAPVSVAPNLAARKLVLYVENRPAVETMRRVADALGGTWVRIDREWRLKADPVAARDEEAARVAEQKARGAAVLGWAERFAKDPEHVEDIPAFGKVAALLGKLGPRRSTEILLSGQTLVATASGRDGTVQVSLQDILEGNPDDAVLNLRLAEDSEFIAVRLTPLFQKGAGGGMSTGVSVGRVKAAPTVYDTHLAAWSVEADATPGEMALKTLKLEEEPSPSGLESLADALARLHARSGVPVVAESFRTPFRAFGEIPGATVRESIRALAKETSWNRTPFAWRTEEGWLLVRPTRPWETRPGEIPEAALRPLEAKEPTLDAYADLCADLTEAQVAATKRSRPLVAFPTAPLRGVRGLALLGSLNASERATVRDKGLLYVQMPPKARDRWDRAYGELVLDFPSYDGTYFDLGGGRRPADAGLRIAEGITAYSGAPDRIATAVEPGAAPEFRQYAASLFMYRLDPRTRFSMVDSVVAVPYRVQP